MRSTRSLALEAFSEDFGRERSTLPDASGSPPLISILAASRPGFVSRGAAVPRAQCLRGARLDTRFLGVRILSHVLRHAGHLDALRALLLDDGSDGRVKV
jgi:hypothetical protein